MLTIRAFNSCARPWAKWLGREVSEHGLWLHNDEAKGPNYVAPNFYEGVGPFVFLIHFEQALTDGRPKQASRLVDAPWSQLPSTHRGKALWLIYSGSGFRLIKSKHERIHYLTYEISRGSEIESEKKQCFKDFISVLQKAETPKSSIWLDLYPSENVAACTVLAVLSLCRTDEDFTSVTQALLKDPAYLKKAHLEFSSRSVRLGMTPDTFAVWMGQLRRSPQVLVRQLVSVLGLEPD